MAVDRLPYVDPGFHPARDAGWETADKLLREGNLERLTKLIETDCAHTTPKPSRVHTPHPSYAEAEKLLQEGNLTRVARVVENDRVRTAPKPPRIPPVAPSYGSVAELMAQIRAESANKALGIQTQVAEVAYLPKAS